MNQRLQKDEIERVSKSYATDAFYCAIQSIGTKLENSTPQFGIRTEESFVYTLALLRKIVEQGRCDVRLRIDEWWETEYAECRRIARRPKEEETRRVVGIVFALAARALLSSGEGFYNDTLPHDLLKAVYDHPFGELEDTLRQILNIDLEDGWFDVFCLKPQQTEVAQTIPTAIPQDCKDAVAKVFIETFKHPLTKELLSSVPQIKKAAGVIHLDKNNELAMLMKVGMELNAVKRTIGNPDFVRALIGIGVIEYTDKDAIKKMADGIRQKCNGTTKSGTTKRTVLPDNHNDWKTQDRKSGNSIYEAMINRD